MQRGIISRFLKVYMQIAADRASQTGKMNKLEVEKQQLNWLRQLCTGKYWNTHWVAVDEDFVELSKSQPRLLYRDRWNVVDVGDYLNYTVTI